MEVISLLDEPFDNPTHDDLLFSSMHRNETFQCSQPFIGQVY